MNGLIRWMARASDAIRLTLCLFAGAVVSGCGLSGQESVQDWIVQQRAQSRPGLTPIAEPKAFTAQPYQVDALPDPFSSQRLTQALRRDSLEVTSAGLVMPERMRPKQPLETFALDTMVMVGSLVRQGQPVALIRIDQRVYPVRQGAYLGQNFGKVIEVTETQVVLREIVQDASGEWTARAASLHLKQESK